MAYADFYAAEQARQAAAAAQAKASAPAAPAAPPPAAPAAPASAQTPAATSAQAAPPAGTFAPTPPGTPLINTSDIATRGLAPAPPGTPLGQTSIFDKPADASYSDWLMAHMAEAGKGFKQIGSAADDFVRAKTDYMTGGLSDRGGGGVQQLNRPWRRRPRATASPDPAGAFQYRPSGLGGVRRGLWLIIRALEPVGRVRPLLRRQERPRGDRPHFGADRDQSRRRGQRRGHWRCRGARQSGPKPTRSAPEVARNALGYGLDTGVPAAVGGYLGGSLEHGLLGAAVGKPMLDSEAGDLCSGPLARRRLEPTTSGSNLLLGGAGTLKQRGAAPPDYKHRWTRIS